MGKNKNRYATTALRNSVYIICTWSYLNGLYIDAGDSASANCESTA